MDLWRDCKSLFNYYTLETFQLLPSRQGCIKCAKCFLSIRFPLCLWLKLFETDDIQLTRVNSFFAFVISISVQEYVNRDKFSFNIIKNGNATRQEAFFWGPLVKALEHFHQLAPCHGKGSPRAATIHVNEKTNELTQRGMSLILASILIGLHHWWW